MSNAANMSTPVTRGELKEELEQFRQEIQEAIAPLASKAELAQLATKAEIQEAIAQLATKAEIAPLATKAEIQEAIAPLATKAEIAQLATKAEIAPLATKAEIAQLATKVEIAQLATKVELAQLATKVEMAQLATKAEIAQLATKVELELWGGALLARIQSSEQGMKELFSATQRQISATQWQLQEDLARHAGALHESMLALITAHDDKYADLPDRVARLEARVFAAR
jgi:hypothetical protein